MKLGRLEFIHAKVISVEECEKKGKDEVYLVSMEIIPNSRATMVYVNKDDFNERLANVQAGDTILCVMRGDKSTYREVMTPEFVANHEHKAETLSYKQYQEYKKDNFVRKEYFVKPYCVGLVITDKADGSAVSREEILSSPLLSPSDFDLVKKIYTIFSNDAITKI